MKKNILLLIQLSVAILFSFLTNAQSIKLGIDGGISIPQLKSSGSNPISQGYTSREAAVFGVFADFQIKNNFSIKTFINYAGQGGKRDGMQPVAGTPYYANFKNQSILNYLEIPVMAKWEWGNKWKYYFNVGPYVGFLLSAKQKTSGSSELYLDMGGTQPLPGGAQPFDANTDIKSSINNVNFGLTGGAGLIYPVCKKSELILDIRGAYGLTHIQKDTNADGKSNTGGLFISLGYAYSIK